MRVAYTQYLYIMSRLLSKSTKAEECRSNCSAILEDYQGRDPDDRTDRLCAGNQNAGQD